MGDLLDIPGTEQYIGGLATGVVAKAKQAMEAKKMGNAVEVQTPSQIAAMDHPRAVLTPMQMIDRALSSNANVETLTQLMNLQERWEANQARKAFDAAIAAAKAEIPPISRNATGHNSKRYADFSAIASVVDPILSKYGLSYRFKTTQTDKINVTCVLSHKEGHAEETTLSGGADTSGSKNAIQAIGSTLTYLQRYSLNAALGLSASNDDDGNASGGNGSVSDEQRIVLQDKIEEVGADIVKFCERWNIPSLSDFPQKKFDEAIQSLNRFAQQQRKQANG